MLAGGGAEVKDRKLTIGHLELTLSDGRLLPVRAMGSIIGAWFSGRGKFRYVSADPIEGHTWRQNLERVTSYRADAQGGIEDSIESALIYFSSGGEPQVAMPGWLDGEPSAAARESFEAHREEWRQDRGWRAEQALPQMMLEAPITPFVLVEIDAIKQDLTYVRDPFRGHDEDLFIVTKVEQPHHLFKGWRYQQLLSEQPIGRKRLDPRPLRFRLVEVAGTLVNSDGIHAAVGVREVFEALAPIRTIELGLMSERTGDSGASANLKRNEYKLQAVTDAEGKPLPYWHRRSDLSVELPRILKAGERFEIRFSMAGDVLFRPNNDNYWDLRDSWFPTPTREGEAYSYHAVVKVAKPFIAFSSGQLVRRWEEDKLACAEFRAAGPIQGAVLLAGKYTTYEEKRDALTVRVSTYGLDKPDAKKRLAGMAFSFIEFYKPLLGDYPWPELDIVEINSYGFAVAPPGIIFITSEAFVASKVDNLVGWVVRGINKRIAHEVAHAWWGNSTLLGSAEENWMWEATAEYYAAYAMGQVKGKKEFEEALRDWRNNAKESADRGSVLLANQMVGEDSFLDRQRLLYSKGPLVLHALREEVGDEAFFTIFKSFQRNFRGKPAYTRDLIGLSSFVAKRDLAPFYQRYVLGTELPPERKP